MRKSKVCLWLCVVRRTTREGGEYFNMAFDEIKKVTEAEEAQKAAKEAAIVKGKEDVSKAQQEAQALLEKAKADATEQVREMIAKAEREAEGKNQSTVAQQANACTAQKQTAQSKLGEAAKLITERVVNSQWQS